MWIIYAPPNDSHSVTDSITVTCGQTSQTWTIPITASSVPRKTAAAALVLDKSGSMNDDRGDGLGSKSQSVRDAANTFMDVMLPGDALSFTGFDDNASVLAGLTTLGDPSDPFDTSRSTMRGIINGTGLNPGGNTSIGDGIFEGRGTLSGATAQVKSLVVLTDGNENRTRWIADVADQINENTYAVGVGTAANTSAAALETISGSHGGYLLITGAAIGGDNEFLLKKYFLQILAGVSNAEVVLDPVGVISARQVQRIPFVICDQDNLADVILLTQDRKDLQFLLETPYGQLVDSNIARAAGGQFVATDRVSYYRIPLPLLVDPGRPSHAGMWNVVLGYGYGRGVGSDTHAAAGGAFPQQRYSVVVHTWSDVAFTAAAVQSGFTPGATVSLIAGTSAAGIPFTAGAHVRAEISKPGDGAVFTMTLQPQGDEFVGKFTATMPGEYQIRVMASGHTDRGQPFTRERTLSAARVAGRRYAAKGRPGRHRRHHRRRPPTLVRVPEMHSADALEERCARSNAGRELGIDPREFVKCVELLCREDVGCDSHVVQPRVRRGAPAGRRPPPRGHRAATAVTTTGRADVAVIGGGPAGAVTALLLARAGAARGAVRAVALRRAAAWRDAAAIGKPAAARARPVGARFARFGSEPSYRDRERVGWRPSGRSDRSCLARTAMAGMSTERASTRTLVRERPKKRAPRVLRDARVRSVSRAGVGLRRRGRRTDRVGAVVDATGRGWQDREGSRREPRSARPAGVRRSRVRNQHRRGR